MTSETSPRDTSETREARLAAKAEMLIRRPVAEVFRAFVDPAVTTNFWFTRSSGPLEAGKQVRWAWDMYGVEAPVSVRTVEENARIVVEWPEEHTSTEWVFTARADGATFVSITHGGFAGDDAQIARQALDSTEGFVLALAGAKAYLEHGIRLNLVADRFPDGIAEQ